MGKSIRIYPATDKDIKDLARIMRSNIEIYHPIMPGAFQKYATYFEEYGVPNTYDVEMIELDGSTIGFIGTIKITDDSIYLLALYLMREYQNKGIGKKIIDDLIHSYSAENRKEIVLLAHKNATWACKFYEKNGFELISMDEGDIKNYSDRILEKHYIRNSVLYSYKLSKKEANL